MRMTVQRLDWFVALPLLASVVMIVEIDPPRESILSIGPFVQGMIVIALSLVVCVSIAAASALDRRCSEEYVFQIMANAALVGFASTMLINLLWLIGVKVFGLPDLSSENMIGILTLCWALAYYWFRIKGIAQ
ncbi:hypothetical protein [uncultured Erythrobacter sp.]|uniref:hypothetical protein n=1 Tax=uncultured Erythrobacter sp. TaxID=263913 RepID=UPI0026293A78|nr:hypothetical protein [uncultured Erythrobacter sp.]